MELNQQTKTGSSKAAKKERFCCQTEPEVKRFLGAACIAITFLTGLTLRTTGLFFFIFIEGLGITRQQAAWPLSLTSAAVAFSGVLSQALLCWFPPWPLMMTASLLQLAGLVGTYFAPGLLTLSVAFGLIHGIGSGMLFVLTGSLLDRTFITKRRHAMNVNIAAFCGAGVVFPGIIAYVEAKFGAAMVFLFCVGLLLPVPFLCAFIGIQEYCRPPPNDKCGKSPLEVTCKSETPLVKSAQTCGAESIFRKPLFFVTAVTHLFFFYVLNVIASIAIDVVLGKDIPMKQTVTIAPVASVLDCVGRVFVPMATEAGYIDRSTLITIDYTVIAIGLLILSFVRDFPRVFLTGVVMGLFNGHAASVHSALMADAVGVDQLPRSNHIVIATASLAFLTKPFLIGYFKDELDSYSKLYQLTSGLMFFSALVWFVVDLISFYKKRGTWTATDTTKESDGDAPALITYRSIDLTSLLA